MPITPPPGGYPGLPVAPPPPPRRRWLVPTIVGGSVAFLALIVAVALLAVQIAGFVPRSPVAGPPYAPSAPEPLLDGEPGEPVAVEPLTCAECFRFPDVQTLALPEASYLRIGLSVSEGGRSRLAASEEQADQTKGWIEGGAAPDSCYFAYPPAPLFFDPGIVDDLPARGDTVLYQPWHTDGDQYYYFIEGIRLFDDTAAATAYLTRLPEAVAGCPEFEFAEDEWRVSLEATAGLELPPSVASYGWVQSDGYTRYFVTDVQRGNAVVRLALFTDADGPSESDFRDLVTEYAGLLAEIEPRP
jgi:hypothetical protein